MDECSSLFFTVLRLSPVNATDQDLGVRERRKCSSNQAMYVPCRKMLEVMHRGTDEKDDKGILHSRANLYL